ncbi:MAG: hybrid sensor histidine kinase/response regulator [Gammaproteobacteria bacterium]|nr:hybrid sensor histidine kinase/response regulator [Gammaproteobacteria bacterium]
MQLSQENNVEFGEFNKLTLRFKDKELEKNYLQQTEPFRLIQLRWAVFIVGLLYCLFSVIDHFALPVDMQDFASRIHLFQGLGLCLLIAISFRIPSVAFIYTVTFLANSITWTNHFVIVLTGDVSLYFVEAYFMLLWVWVASGFSFTLSVKYNLFFILINVLVMQIFGSFPSDVMIIHYMFIFASIALGGFGGYMVEYYKRQSFLSYEMTIQAKIQAEQANRTKDKFFSIISHDLRGPIGSVSVILNNVAKCGADLTDELYPILCRASKNSYLLLENLLTWANSQNGVLECKPRNFRLMESVEHCMDLYQGSAQQKEIQLHVNIEPELYAYADFEMVNTVGRNLINNAIKFTHQKGTIEISAARVGDMLTLTVADNGVGISTEIQESLFQVDKKTYSSMGTESETGSGMGLSLCADFIHRNGGVISVESEEDKGSTFTFSLPLGAIGMNQDAIAEKIKGWKVLVVEDNPLHQTTTKQALQGLGVEVLIAGTGKDAVEMAIKEMPKLVLMDFELPDFTGDIAAKQIVEQSSNPPLKIIALTSYSKMELDQKAIKSKFDAYLHKPLKSIELLDCLERVETVTT